MILNVSYFIAILYVYHVVHVCVVEEKLWVLKSMNKNLKMLREGVFFPILQRGIGGNIQPFDVQCWYKPTHKWLWRAKYRSTPKFFTSIYIF